jgi:hypothetical protein
MRLRFNIHQGFPIIGHLFYATWGLKLRLVRIENKVFAKNLVWMMAFSVQDRIDQDTCGKKSPIPDQFHTGLFKK